MEALVCSMSLNQKCCVSRAVKAVVLIMLPLMRSLGEVIRLGWRQKCGYFQWETFGLRFHLLYYS